MTVATYAPNPNASGLLSWAEQIQDAEILPDAYRGRPANIIVAAMLGEGMGLTWIQALYRINVIKGKPAASAELIASNVRAAGHILRVETSHEPPAARAVIIRKDDPGFEFVSIWNIARAQRAGLANKDNWQRDPLAMLRSRATTECARMACPEALYGVAYDPGELGEPEPPAGREDGAQAPLAASEPVTFPEPEPANGWSGPAVLTPADFAAEPARVPEPEPAPVVGLSGDELNGPPQPEPGVTESRPISDSQRRMMFALFNQLPRFNEHPAHSGKGRAERMLFVNGVLGRDHSGTDYVESTSDLTVSEAARVIDRLEGLVRQSEAGQLPVEP